MTTYEDSLEDEFATQNRDIIIGADDGGRSKAAEQSGRNHPKERAQAEIELGRIGNLGEGAIGDVIAVIGDEGLDLPIAQPRRRAHGFEAVEGQLPAEGDDLDR